MGRSHRAAIRCASRSTHRGGRRDVARLWLTAPCRPIRCRFSQHRTAWPGVPSFLSPTRLAVGFGPKELSPTPARRSQLAIHPADLSEKVRVGPPPPGATRELGILAMQLSPIDIRLGGRFVNAHEASLFTQVRGRRILGSSAQARLYASGWGEALKMGHV